jgi:hypothetical protein
VTLGTNTLPPSSSSATARFRAARRGALYDTVWDLAAEPGDVYGWRMGDGEYGTNNNIQTVPDGGESALFSPSTMTPRRRAILYARS